MEIATALIRLLELEDKLDRILEGQERIEKKLDRLLAVAEEEKENWRG